MTAPEFATALQSLGISHTWLAERLGVSRITSYRWSKGELPVPQYAAVYIELLIESLAKRR